MEPQEKFDVVVVGGGPAGGITARDLAEKGLRTIILEEHGIIGEPVHCAGLMSIDGLNNLGVIPSREVVLNKVRGASVFSPSGARLTVERESAQAYVVDRGSFDRQIVREAVRKGSALMLNRKARLLEIGPEEASVTLHMAGTKGSRKNMKLRSELVVLCEGPLATLTRQVGLDTPNPRMRLYATQFEMNNVKLERDDIVQLYLGRSFAPGFFAWIIPTGSDSARVGLASVVPDTLRFLKYFVSTHHLSRDMFVKARMNRVAGGIVLTGGPTRRTYSDRLLAVGDCAGQTKPTTGGGVVTGGMCAKIAAKVASESLVAQDFSKKYLAKYQRTWQRELGREFKMMLRARLLLNCLPDRIIDRLVSTAKMSGLSNLMEREGHIDMQSNFFRTILRNPKVIIVPVLSLLGIL